jgi:hypothetical protein
VEHFVGLIDEGAVSRLAGSLYEIVKISSNLRDARWVAGIREDTHFVLAEVGCVVRTEVIHLVRLDDLSPLI